MGRSLWQRENSLETPPPVFAPLEGDRTAGMVVVGGGLAGLLTAYLLQQGGAQVLLLEADRIASGASGRNTGKVTCQHGDVYHTLWEKRGRQTAEHYYQASRMGVELMQELVAKHHIPCDWMEQDDYIFTNTEEGEEALRNEWKAYRELGIAGMLVDSLPVGLNIRKGLRMDRQHGYNPYAFAVTIARAFVQMGGAICEETRVTDVEKGEPCILHTAGGDKVRATQVVWATGMPTFDGGGLYFARLEPKRFYLMAWPAPKEGGGALITIDGDESTPSIRYARSGKKDWLLVGGSEHGTGRGNGHAYDDLRVWAAHKLGLGEPVCRWSAQDNATPDQLPYLGRLIKGEKNQFVLAGFNLWGNSWSAAGAKILSDVILHGGHPLAATFAPDRSGIWLNPALLKENLQMAGEFISSKFSAAHPDLPEERGKGQVVSLEGKRYGAYRDEKGKLFVVDITCPHLGCELRWNRGDRSWDCPCHGSRFRYDGRVLDGPATACLAPQGEEFPGIDPHVFG